MRQFLLRAVVACALPVVFPAAVARAQDESDSKIYFAHEREEQAREQLRRLLASHDLDPWIFTHEVRIESGAEPHSMPVLTLNTDFLDDDEMQLSIFLHEQAHWFVDQAPSREAAVEALRRMYPNPPRPDAWTYDHLLVAWIELDAMAELLGEREARRVMEAKVTRLTGDPALDRKVATAYRWYNERVLEETSGIGTVLADHDLVITPGSGLVIGTGVE